MRNIVFASSNDGKTAEIKKILENSYQVLNLIDIGCTVDIPETADTFQGNALQKSTYVWEHFNMDCFADDSGLEVNSLGGAPGVFSARYSGTRDSESNIDYLLENLKNTNDRSAQFRTVISLLIDGKNHFFEGIIEGTILHERRGNGGFGYDPIFVPNGYNKSFAELDASEKNKISHRAIALTKMIEYLENQQNHSF